MKAVVVDPSVSGRLILQEVDRPSLLPSEALIKVAAISLNRGEVRRAQTAAAGWRPGWDLAGTIESPAADGSGFSAGTRVVGFVPSGAWSEYVAVPTDAIAALPDSVSFADASTLPVAGLTALHGLAKGGLLLGKSVLITGASGGVGYFAVQLARQAGAIVTAQLRRADWINFIEEAGAHRTIVGESLKEFSPYDVILDSTGGTLLSNAISAIAKDGICVTYGTTVEGTVTFDAKSFYGAGGASLYGFILFHELKREPAAIGLAKLVQLLADQRLKPHIDRTASWTEIAAIAQQLTDRQFIGKAVLHIS
ncbi:zinc-binding dehydrogenase [Leptolyngbya sp. AN03gr2]|uniref:zinc-binding dehydrogenase n=1 Tax=unclassified Leptolyngbya TaxID=2650499 RepID=UPI003D3158A4